MKQLFFLLFFWVAIILPFSTCQGDISNKRVSTRDSPLLKSKKLKINIISRPSKAGLASDVEILKKELIALGHSPRWVNIEKLPRNPYADVNIFLEIYTDTLFGYGEKNYLFPNAEWYSNDIATLSSFDLILCKTREAERIFKNYNANSIFTSFTSKDCFDPKTKKNYKLALHLAGQSQQKGTNSIINAWSQNPHFPGLFIIVNFKKKIKSISSNLIFIHDYLPKTKLQAYQNHCGLHICPSETEGFGHYLMEALSCAAVVVTTDAPPMNEFISDSRCLVGYKNTEPQRLATNYYVDELQLSCIMDSLINLPEKELVEIGCKNRQFYLENDRFFKDCLASIFPQVYNSPNKNRE